MGVVNYWEGAKMMVGATQWVVANSMEVANYLAGAMTMGVLAGLLVRPSVAQLVSLEALAIVHPVGQRQLWPS